MFVGSLREKFVINTITLIIAGLLLYFFGGKDLFIWIINNPFTSILYFLAYSFIGSIYMIVDWYFYCLKKRDQLLDYLGRVSKTAEDRAEYIKWHTPSASDNKALLIGKMMWWPFALITSFVGDYIVRFFTKLFNSLTLLLNNITSSVFKNVK
jgi:hypothetical protein